MHQILPHSIIDEAFYVRRAEQYQPLTWDACLIAVSVLDWRIYN
jgi:hypothetical protein